jgi:hypothetical protein
MIKVGQSCLPWPGDIYVSENLIAQIGMPAVRQLVRDQYRAAHEWRQREIQRMPASPNTKEPTA